MKSGVAEAIFLRATCGFILVWAMPLGPKMYTSSGPAVRKRFFKTSKLISLSLSRKEKDQEFRRFSNHHAPNCPFLALLARRLTLYPPQSGQLIPHFESHLASGIDPGKIGLVVRAGFCVVSSLCEQFSQIQIGF